MEVIDAKIVRVVPHIPDDYEDPVAIHLLFDLYTHDPTIQFLVKLDTEESVEALIMALEETKQTVWKTKKKVQ